MEMAGSFQVGMLTGEDWDGEEESFQLHPLWDLFQVDLGQDGDVEAKAWEVVLDEEDDVEDGDEWEEKKKEEEG